MVNIQKVDNVIKFTFTDSDFYLYNNGTIEVPLNSLSLYIDESDMITYKKANSNDIFVSVPIDQTNFSSKADAIDFYKENMVGAVGGSDPNAFVGADYDSQTERINFYNASGSVVDYIDASAFIVDGMIDDVYIDNGYLVIDFNTASGKQDIRIPLSDIFDPDNYYDKQAIDTKLNNYQTISGLSAVTLSTFVNDADFVTTAITDEISTALATLSGEVDTNEEVTSRALNLLSDELANKQDTLIAGDNITISGNTISATGGEIPQNISYFTNDVGYVTSAVTDAINSTIEQNELIVASSLVDLDERKADVSGITDYSSAITEINNTLTNFQLSLDGIFEWLNNLQTSMDEKEEVVARALVYLYNHNEPTVKNYFAIKALEDGDISFLYNTQQSPYYSLDGGSTWTNMQRTTISVQSGDTVMFKAEFEPNQSRNIGSFTSTGQYEVKGNVMSLIFGDDFENQTDLTGYDDVFQRLFAYSSGITSAENLELPADTLASSCYTEMFSNCTSLETAPELPATTLAEYCYKSMFNYCSSLTSAPELPALTMESHCYDSMFHYCTSLATAPELPSTSLALGCYISMFNGCSSLEMAPDLLADTLEGSCYGSMFSNCTNLNYVKMLATTIGGYSLTNWLLGVSQTGTFVKSASQTSLPTGISGIPDGWTVIDE